MNYCEYEQIQDGFNYHVFLYKVLFLLTHNIAYLCSRTSLHFIWIVFWKRVNYGTELWEAISVDVEKCLICYVNVNHWPNFNSFSRFDSIQRFLWYSLDFFGFASYVESWTYEAYLLLWSYILSYIVTTVVMIFKTHSIHTFKINIVL